MISIPLDLHAVWWVGDSPMGLDGQCPAQLSSVWYIISLQTEGGTLAGVCQQNLYQVTRLVMIDMWLSCQLR